MNLQVEIHKQLGKFRLDVCLDTTSGHITGLLGASGCGKSLTLKCIAGIEQPDRGRIVLDGRVLFDSERHINLPPQKRQVGYLFQHYALFPHMTVAQNIAVGVRERARRKERVAQLISALYLEGQAHKHPHQLSGGQQQRVALARILASRPQVLLLDEPFSALDSYLKWQVEQELAQLLSDFSGPMLLVTHNREEVRQLCRQVCVLDHGRSQPCIPAEQLFTAPATLSACLLSGCRNLSRASVNEDGMVEAEDWQVSLSPGSPLPQGLTHIAIQAHCVKPAPGPGPNRLLCQVEQVVNQAFSTQVLLTTPGGSQGFSQLRMEVAQDVWAALGAPPSLWVELPPDCLLPLTS